MSTSHAFALFETSIGTCGIAWGTHGVVGVQLPEHTEEHMRLRLKRRFRDSQERSPSPVVQTAIEAITALLDGTSTDLGFIELDTRAVPPFHQRVYEVARTIPPGCTLSYGDIAARLGEPAWPAARDVGQALGRNPFPIVVPCHRVVAAGGKLGGFSARGGLTIKRKLLAIEVAACTSSQTRAAASAAAFNIPLFADFE